MSYKLASYQSPDGPRAAIILGERVIDIARATRTKADVTVLGIFEDWQKAKVRLEALSRRQGLRGQPLAKAKILAPIPVPAAIYCAGSNYSDHSAEMARASGREPPPDPHTIGQRSWHFIKSPRAVTSHNATVKRPDKCKKLDWEVELAVVIGRKCKDVSEKDAMKYVGGYMIANDLSARDLGDRKGLPAAFATDWLAHKSFDGSCPMGPWIVPAKDIKDPMNLKLELEVNGTKKQDSSTSKMIFNIVEQIADLSSKITLWPGDIIMTGTPHGVGNGRGEYLNPGDVVRARVEGIGELVTKIA